MDVDCDHPIKFNGLCAICGSELVEYDYEVPTDRLHILHDRNLNVQEAERVEKQVLRELLLARKLSLVIDLDQTILHATRDPAVEQWLSDPEHPNHVACHALHRIALTNSGTTAPQPYFIQLRPGLMEFLEWARDYFELHIYTMGSREYARAFLEERKSLKRLFPHEDRSVLVLDDRGDVWEHCDNLLPIAPFTFFTGTGDIHSRSQRAERLAGVEARVGENVLDGESHGAEDSELENARQRLAAIHERFFSQSNHLEGGSVKPIVSAMKRQILANCRIAFSAHLQGTDLPALAASLGATVGINGDDVSVTHLITSRSELDNTLLAEFNIDDPNTVFIVNPGWLQYSSWKWQRQLEIDFIVSSSAPSTSSLSHSPSNSSLVNLQLLSDLQRELDEEDDDEEEEGDYDAADFPAGKRVRVEISEVGSSEDLEQWLEGELEVGGDVVAERVNAAEERPDSENSDHSVSIAAEMDEGDFEGDGSGLE